ncbi:alpha/beta fold hydrolase [Thalassococcus sp. BH17M4-6]|uniref:alpha/beta fold hydrolase n=1 Tax=Thalassococcus sp. BH17M4-6 TaxID=3413148 RepID=UPI003BC24298
MTTVHTPHPGPARRAPARLTEALVLLPGLLCDARLFAPQVEALSREIGVMVAPVAPGERLEEIASNLLPQLPLKCALAGHGLGGMVAMELMRRAPERITRIALMDTSPLAETPQEASAREPQIVGARAGRLAEVAREALPSAALAPGPQRAALMHLVGDMGRALGAESFVHQSRALQRRRDQQGTLRRCKVPALVLCGAHDSLYPVKRHSFMAELIPHAELRVIEDAGHLPTLEAPEATTDALRDWLRQPYVLR